MLQLTAKCCSRGPTHKHRVLLSPGICTQIHQLLSPEHSNFSHKASLLPSTVVWTSAAILLSPYGRCRSSVRCAACCAQSQGNPQEGKGWAATCGTRGTEPRGEDVGFRKEVGDLQDRVSPPPAQGVTVEPALCECPLTWVHADTTHSSLHLPPPLSFAPPSHTAGLKAICRSFRPRPPNVPHFHPWYVIVQTPPSSYSFNGNGTRTPEGSVHGNKWFPESPRVWQYQNCKPTLANPTVQ